MADLYKKSNPQEDIVGWFSTRATVPETSFFIHDYYARFSGPNLVHLTVDCSVETDRMPIKAYVSSPMGLLQVKDKESSTRFDQPAIFAQVPVEVFCWEAERVGRELV